VEHEKKNKNWQEHNISLWIYNVLKVRKMKAVFIIYNQAHSEKVEYMLEKLEVRGFSKWPEMMGKGTVNGDPHMNSHTWPEINSGTITMVDNDKVDVILEKVGKLNSVNEEVGIRAFVWDIEKTV